MLPTVDEKYHLMATIDASGGHFTNRFIYRNQVCFYDGMYTNGSLRVGLSASMRNLRDDYMLEWQDSKLNGKFFHDNL
jgi:hypothetical protein